MCHYTKFDMASKLQRDRDQVILFLETGSQMFLWNTGLFTHSYAHAILSFLALLFTCQLRRCFSCPGV